MKTVFVNLYDIKNQTFFKFEIEEVFVGMKVAHHKKQCHLYKENFNELLQDRSCLVQLEGENYKGKMISHFRFVINKVQEYDVKFFIFF